MLLYSTWGWTWGASTNTSTTCHALSIQSDVITQQQQYIWEYRNIHTHTHKLYEFIVLWSAFINYIHMYIVDCSHWTHLYLTSLLRFYCNESRGSLAKSQQRGLQWPRLPYGPKTVRDSVYNDVVEAHATASNFLWGIWANHVAKRKLIVGRFDHDGLHQLQNWRNLRSDWM